MYDFLWYRGHECIHMVCTLKVVPCDTKKGGICLWSCHKLSWDCMLNIANRANLNIFILLCFLCSRGPKAVWTLHSTCEYLKRFLPLKYNHACADTHKYVFLVNTYIKHKGVILGLFDQCFSLLTVMKKLHNYFLPFTITVFTVSHANTLDLCLFVFVGGKSQLVGVWLLKAGVGTSVALGSVAEIFLHTVISIPANLSCRRAAPSKGPAFKILRLFVAGILRRGCKLWWQVLVVWGTFGGPL